MRLLERVETLLQTADHVGEALILHLGALTEVARLQAELNRSYIDNAKSLAEKYEAEAALAEQQRHEKSGKKP